MKSFAVVDSKQDRESLPRYNFAGIKVDGQRHTISRDGLETHVRAKSFEVLLFLIERRDRLVTKEKLLGELWRETAVTENSLVQCIIEIRKALGDDARKPQFIKTIPKIGYQFVGVLEEPAESVEIGPALPPRTVDGRHGEMGDHPAPVPVENGASAPGAAEFLLRIQPLSRTLSLGRYLGFAGAVLALLCVAGIGWQRSRGGDVMLPHIAGKHSLAVLYFENQSGNKELDWLRQGLPDMLIAQLSQYPAVSVLGRPELGSLFDRLSISRDQPVRWEDAVRVAETSHAEMTVLGSFARLGEKIRIAAEVHDPKSGRVLAAQSVLANRLQDILPQMEVLSRTLAAGLGIASEAHAQPGSLAVTMTSNLEAYRCYSIALEQSDSLYAKDAIALYERAVRLDPGFAMAQARIGYTYANVWGRPVEGLPYLSKAFAMSGRLTVKDRMVIAAWYSVAKGDYEQAIGAFQKLIAAYPEAEWYRALATLLRGQQRNDESLSALQKAIALDPGGPANFNQLAGLYAILHRHTDNVHAAQTYVSLSRGSANSYDTLGLAFHLAGRYAEAERAFEESIERKPDFEIPSIHLASLHVERGRYRRAIDDCRRYLRVAPSEYEQRRGYGCLADVYWGKHDLSNLRRVPGDHVALFIEEGNFRRAREVIEAPVTTATRGRRQSSRGRYCLLARLALAEHKNDEAIRLLRQGASDYLQIGTVSLDEDCLANGLLALGRLDDAAKEYERLIAIYPVNGMLHYRLGTALDRRGDHESAEREFRRFLELWKDADPDIPELVAAQRRLASPRNT